jgi:glycosyltransferase involved in cell wall biosynthesis
MVPTQAMLRELERHGFPAEDLRLWSHGVDLEMFSFNPTPNIAWYQEMARKHSLIGPTDKLSGPILLFVGRLGEEKNVEFFLDLPVEGTKVVVGDGPLLGELKRKYPKALFFGRQPHDLVPRFMENANVFPFPSLSETFGLVNLEAAATGTPVVVFDYLKEILSDPAVGRTVPFSGNRDHDLSAFAAATNEVLSRDRSKVRTYAEGWSWDRSVIEMLAYLRYFDLDANRATLPGALQSQTP